MEYQVNGVGGGASLSNSSSSSAMSSVDPTTVSANNNYSSSSISNYQNHYHRNHNHRNNGNNNEDPMHSWWESVSKARTRIHSLISILCPDYNTHKRDSISSPDIDGDEFNNNDVSLLLSNLSSLADSDRPARSLLESFDAYSAISASLCSPHSGSGDDNLCQWLYDTFQSSDPDLRLVVLSFVPLVAGLYLLRVHSCSTIEVDALTPSLAGFEAVLLALYASETRARGGKPVVISIPDLSQPSLYHNPSPNSSGSHRSMTGKPTTLTTMQVSHSPSVGVVCPPLEPQVAVKSTKRGCIVGVAFDSYYKHISLMPSWSKIELCRFAAAWAGADCSCSNSLDHPNLARHECYDDEYIENDEDLLCSLDTNDVAALENNVADHMASLQIQDNHDDSDAKGGARIPLPWELLQPILRILGHCLLGPLNSQDIRDAAGVAVRRLYARASHDLIPQAILATRSLIQLDNRARAAADAAAIANVSSTANTPSSKTKKPEVLLVSK